MDDIKTEDVAIETPEITNTTPTVEDQARAKGWRPKEEFEGNEGQWRTATQFIEHGELLDHIHQQNRKIKKLTESTENLLGTMSTIKQDSYNKAMSDLRLQMRQAVEQGDITQVESIQEQQFKLVNSTKTEETKIDPEIDKEAKLFVQNNPWFHSQPVNGATAQELAMSTFAMAKEKELMNSGLDYSTVLQLVKEEVVKSYPSYFSNTNKTKPASVSSSGTMTKKDKTYSFSDLPDEHKDMVKQLQHSMGVKFNLNKYIEDLKNIGVIN